MEDVCSSPCRSQPETNSPTPLNICLVYILFVCVILCGVCVCVCVCVCVNVFDSVYGHGDQGRTVPPSLSLAPYSLETRSLSKPGAQPVTSEPQDPAVSTPNLNGNFRCVALLFVGLVWF